MCNGMLSRDEVPRTYFPMRVGHKVKLYHDAHQIPCPVPDVSGRGRAGAAAGMWAPQPALLGGGGADGCSEAGAAAPQPRAAVRDGPPVLLAHPAGLAASAHQIQAPAARADAEGWRLPLPPTPTPLFP
jgi:hypothetical protein